MSEATDRRRERRARQATAAAQHMRPITYDLPVYELLSAEGVQRLHDASMRILSEFGIDFYDEEARAILKDHGADVRGDTVFFDEGLIAKYVALAPRQFTQLARNPANSVTIGGNQVVFAPVYGPPFVQDLAGGRREATLADFQNFVKLAYLSPYIHHSGGTIVEPTDEPVSTRHLDMLLSHITYSDKAFMGSVTSGPNAADGVAMAEILFGVDAIRERPALLSLINVSSPRRYDERMLAAIKVYARARQAMIITPFILAGAMGPVSIAGTVAQLNAEALAGIALCQMIEPGTPVVYGSFLSTIDLQSGSPTFGTPESQVALYASAQMARHYGLPFRGGGMFASSKLPDAQAGYESVMVMQPTILARTNFVLHAAGWLENGGGGLREVRAGLRDPGDAAHLGQGARPVGRGAGLGCRGRGGAGRALPGHPAHAAPLPRRVLPRRAVRLQLGRAVGAERRGGQLHPREPQGRPAAGRLRGARARSRHGRGAARVRGPAERRDRQGAARFLRRCA